MAKTTSGFNSDRAIWQYAHGRWAVRAKKGKNGRLDGRRGETGSRNMVATPKINFLTLISYSLLQTVFTSDRRQTDDTLCHRRDR